MFRELELIEQVRKFYELAQRAKYKNNIKLYERHNKKYKKLKEELEQIRSVSA